MLAKIIPKSPNRGKHSQSKLLEITSISQIYRKSVEKKKPPKAGAIEQIQANRSIA